jgi:hypothetical protein
MPHEQTEFITKALRDELSAEGLEALRKGAQFGPLKELFPAEADAWASQAGVKAEDCVGLRMERNGIRAEVVLVRSPNHESRPPFRIVRCNNVKQMALELPKAELRMSNAENSDQ